MDSDWKIDYDDVEVGAPPDIGSIDQGKAAAVLGVDPATVSVDEGANAPGPTEK